MQNSEVIDLRSEVTFDIPDKSPADKKEYRVIRLPNKLVALLISDVTVADAKRDDSLNELDSTNEIEDKNNTDDKKLVAASLRVEVGSFSDPLDVQGMSHFLEHMIFMGSEKYPEENDFDNLIKSYGGQSNAETDYEYTKFYFQIDSKYLEEALDRFAQFFIAPLIRRDTMDREREIVQSEFSSKQHFEEIKRIQLLAQLVEANHPYRLFSWGNLKTLKENIDDEKLYEKIHEFRRRHYSAHRMYLTVQASKSLDSLEEIVRRYFSDVPCNDLPPIDFSQFNETNSFRPEFTNRIYFMKPETDVNKINITWCLPTYMNEYKTRPMRCIAYLLTYEGKGSLLSYLMKKSWALKLFYSEMDHTTLHVLYSISIHLTDDGLNNLKQIISTVFSYVKLLHEEGVSERIFQELKTQAATDFKYVDEPEALTHVTNLVDNLRRFPSKYVITGSKLHIEYNEEVIRKILNVFNSNKCNIMLISSKPYPNVVYDQTEKWFGTEYTSWPLEGEWATLYEDTGKLDELHIPEPNQFLTTDFSIFHPKLTGDEAETDPEIILKNELCELWFKPDHKFGLPSANIYFYLISPLYNKNVLNAAIGELMCFIFDFHMKEELFPATNVGLHFNVTSSDRGIVVKIRGYNQKLGLLVDAITKKLTNFVNDITDVQFNNARRQMLRFHNNTVVKPRLLNYEIRTPILNRHYWSDYDKYSALQNARLDDLQLFVTEFLKELKILALIQGNILKGTALSVMTNILDNLKCEKVKDMNTIAIQTVKIPLGERYICAKSFNKKDVNSFTHNYYQIDTKSIRTGCLLDLLVQLHEEPVFNQLRTKENLGYSVHTGTLVNNGANGYFIHINSQEDKYSLEYVEERVEECRKMIKEIIQNMPEERFDGIRNSVINVKQIVPNDLYEDAYNNWNEISLEDYTFKRNKFEVDCLKTITKNEVIEFIESYSTGGKNYRKLSIQVRGSVLDQNGSVEDLLNGVIDEGKTYNLMLENPEQINAENPKIYITDIEEFKKELIVFPKINTLLENEV